MQAIYFENNASKIGQEIEKNFYQFIEAFCRLSEFQLQNNSSISWYASSLPHPMFSLAFTNSNMTFSDLNECMKNMEETNSPFFLTTGIIEDKDDNEQHIKDCDLTSFGPLDGMSFDLSKQFPSNIPSIKINIKQVSSEKDYHDFAKVMSEAAGINPNIGLKFFTSYSCYEKSQFIALIAYVNDRPVGCSVIFMPEGDVAGNYCAWVLPDFRKKGINSAMVIERLKIAKERGYKYLIAQCMDTSTRLYANLGFKKRCELSVYGKEKW